MIAKGTHKKLKLIIENGRPHGIRDENGYLFFFAKVDKYQGQDERYHAKLVEQFALADYLMDALSKRTTEAERPAALLSIKL